MVKCQTIINLIEEYAPKNIAEEWDNPGLQVGDPSAEVDRVLVTLDVDLEVIEEAIKNNIKMIVSHHPILMRPIKSIRFDQPLGKIIGELIKNGITLYSAHTNLDSITGGVNDILAEKIGLVDTEVLMPSTEEKLVKIAVFVPEGHVDRVRDAMSSAGAGWVGNYSDCSFQVAGIGTFKAREGADPFIGEVGKLEKIPEVRIETIVPEKYLSRVVKAMIKAHPYEEVAYDIIPLLNKGKVFGLGRVGYLPEPVAFIDFIQHLKKVLNIINLRAGGPQDRIIRKVALCGGGGGSLISKAAFFGADVYVTGDVKYHEGQEALKLGMNFVDAGHFTTENIIIPVLVEYLREKVKKNNFDVEIIMSQVDTNPYVYL